MHTILFIILMGIDNCVKIPYAITIVLMAVMLLVADFVWTITKKKTKKDLIWTGFILTATAGLILFMDGAEGVGEIYVAAKYAALGISITKDITE